MGNLDSPWILLAQSVAIWAPYSSVKNIQVVLKWQFNVSVEESLRLDKRKSRAENSEVKVGKAGSLFQDACIFSLSFSSCRFFMTVGIPIVLGHNISCAMLLSMHDPLERSTGEVRLLGHTNLLLSPLDLHWKTFDSLELYTSSNDAGAAAFFKCIIKQYGK